MNDRLDKLNDAASQVSLRAHERDAMRARLSAYMAMRPVRTEAVARQGAVKRPFIHLSLKPMPFLAVFLSLMVAGGGVSYAAEGAMPGDALYPVKVHVNEEVRTAFALDPEAKAEWIASRAERRLTEARAVIESDAAPELLERIESNFAAHEQRVEEVIAKVEEKKGPEAAARISSQLEASLAAHRTILEKLSMEKSGDAEIEGETEASTAVGSDTDEKPATPPGRFVAKIARANEKVKEVRERNEKEVKDAEAAKRALDAALGKLAVAQGIEAELSVQLGDENEGLGARVLASLTASIEEAQQLIAAGDVSFEAGSYNDAFRSYTGALRELRGAEIFAEGKFAATVAKKKTDDGTGTAKAEKVAVEPTKPIEKIVATQPKTWVAPKQEYVKPSEVDADRARAAGKREIAMSERTKLSARIDGYAADGYQWGEGIEARAKADAQIGEGDARFANGRYDAAFESFYEAYRIASGANGKYVYVPIGADDEHADDPGAEEARERAEMKRGYAMQQIVSYEAQITIKIGYVGEEHEYVAEMRAKLDEANGRIATGDAKFAAGDYDGAYETYLSVWSVL